MHRFPVCGLLEVSLLPMLVHAPELVFDFAVLKRVITAPEGYHVHRLNMISSPFSSNPFVHLGGQY